VDEAIPKITPSSDIQQQIATKIAEFVSLADFPSKNPYKESIRQWLYRHGAKPPSESAYKTIFCRQCGGLIDNPVAPRRGYASRFCSRACKRKYANEYNIKKAHALNPPKSAEEKARLKAESQAKRRAYNRKYFSSPERREYVKDWKRRNPDRINEHGRRRDAARLGNTVDLRGVARFYKKAKCARLVRCYLCGKPVPKNDRHVDHIVPIAKGGAHAVFNLGVTCSFCNLSKHDKMPEEVGLLPFTAGTLP
jgi:5-methylcytosine-specific restriction endonuclease McrA